MRRKMTWRCEVSSTIVLLGLPLDLEESSEVVYLPATDSKQQDCLDDGPPLHSVVRGLGGVTVQTLSGDYVLLLVLDGFQGLAECPDLLFNRRSVAIVLNIHDAMHVERHSHACDRAHLVAEAVCVAAIQSRCEAVGTRVGLCQGVHRGVSRVRQPEVEVELSSCRDLEGDSHFILRG